jgi:hypothetical protein
MGWGGHRAGAGRKPDSVSRVYSVPRRFSGHRREVPRGRPPELWIAALAARRTTQGSLPADTGHHDRRA